MTEIIAKIINGYFCEGLMLDVLQGFKHASAFFVIFVVKPNPICTNNSP